MPNIDEPNPCQVCDLTARTATRPTGAVAIRVAADATPAASPGSHALRPRPRHALRPRPRQGPPVKLPLKKQTLRTLSTLETPCTSDPPLAKPPRSRVYSCKVCGLPTRNFTR